MKKASFPPVIVITLLALTSLMCTLGGPVEPVSTPDASQKQATLAVMQVTVNAASGESRKTAQAWMTEVSPVIAGSGGQALPTHLPSGTIRGSLTHPGGGVPPMRVVAINIETSEYASVEVEDRDYYTLEQVPEGDYYVLVYPMDGDLSLVGGYSEAVICGLQQGCDDHSLIIVRVNAGEVTNAVDPIDWSAPAGTFPPQP